MAFDEAPTFGLVPPTSMARSPADRKARDYRQKHSLSMCTVFGDKIDTWDLSYGYCVRK